MLPIGVEKVRLCVLSTMYLHFHDFSGLFSLGNFFPTSSNYCDTDFIVHEIVANVSLQPACQRLTELYAGAHPSGN